jgi:hypothetical protein
MSLLSRVFNHLVLPPKLPGKQDHDLDSVGSEILVRLIQATKTLDGLEGHSQDQESPWSSVRQSLLRCQSLHDSGRLEKQSLVSEFVQLKHNRPLILHITEQNAAVIVRREVR